jgi:signal transduction histidine kinase
MTIDVPSRNGLLHDKQAPNRNLYQLERLASLGTLSAGLAHEIKNALVGVNTFINLLLDKNQDAQLAEIVRRELSRIDSIASQMLNLSNPADPKFAPVPMHQLLEHALTLVQHQLRAKSISLQRSFDAASDVIQGDEFQLEQSMLNLLLNALEAMAPHGQLVITTELITDSAKPNRSARMATTRLRVIIKDDGAGIPAKNMERLFEPFFTTKEGGTGLGLAITQRIIQQHGGSIEASSRPNEGSTFTMLLPSAAK